jgi:hypothetical protein
MRSMILEQKTGFSSTLPFTIYEDDGTTIFYDSTFTDHIAKGEKLNFNLPAFEYRYDGSFIKLDSPVATKTINLPLPERNIPRGKYDIIFGDNPSKCTILYDEKIILFDNSFKSEPLYIKYGIYFHELGHHWYKSEDKADTFAVWKMLNKGFNPSQIMRLALEGLSDKSDERRAKILSMLTNNAG